MPPGWASRPASTRPAMASNSPTRPTAAASCKSSRATARQPRTCICSIRSPRLRSADKRRRSINGATTYSVSISSTDNLQDLIANINNLGSGVQASEVNDGSSIYPFRMTLTSGQSGAAGQLQVDYSNAPFTLQQTTAGQDALLIVGTPGAGGLPGLFADRHIQQRFARRHAERHGHLIDPGFAERHPRQLQPGKCPAVVRERLQHGDVEHRLGDHLHASDTNAGNFWRPIRTFCRSNRICKIWFPVRCPAVGSITSLASLGITISQSGTMSLDTNQLENQLATNPQAVQSFFSTANNGLSAKFQTAITRLAGPNHSLLVDQTNALATEIQDNTARIAVLELARSPPTRRA